MQTPVEDEGERIAVWMVSADSSTHPSGPKTSPPISLLIEIATYQCGVVCLRLQFLPVLPT